MTLTHKRFVNGNNIFHIVDEDTRVSLCGMSDNAGRDPWDDKTYWNGSDPEGLLAGRDKEQIACNECFIASPKNAWIDPIEIKSVPQTLLNYDFALKGKEIGELVKRKNNAYGDSFFHSGEFLRLLYPTGIKPEQYDDVMTIARVYDKLQRIATDKDAFGENPWSDIVGYGLLSIARREVSGH